MPDFTLPDFTMEDVNKVVLDSAYAAIGFGVLSFQRAQVRRRELLEQLQNNSGVVGTQVTAAREQLTEVAKLVDEQVAPIRRQIDEQFDELEGRLPAATRNVFATIRSGAQAQESYIRSAVGLKN
jgi:ElaB/YqjD/DUF883 family membrane-anchored ribosome-binding protein